MFQPSPAPKLEGTWSDRDGIIKCNPALAFSRRNADPGDFAPDGFIAEYGAALSALWGGGTGLQSSRPTKQVGALCR